MFHALLVILALLVYRGLAVFPGGYTFGIAKQPLSSTTCTITPGPSPDGQTGYTYYSCRLSSPRKDSVYGTVVSSLPGPGPVKNCQPGKGDWCFIFQRAVFGRPVQVSDGMILKATDSITFQHIMGNDGKTWTVNAAINGRQVSSFVSPSGPLNSYNVLSQCLGKCVQASTPVKFTNLAVTLSVADPNFGKNARIQGGIPGSVQASPETSDQTGKVWSVNQVTVQPFKG